MAIQLSQTVLVQTIQFSISIDFVYTQLNVKTVLYQTIQFTSSLAQWVVFTNGPGDLGSIPGHVIPKTLKMVLDTSLLNTQQYKVCIKGKVEQSRERSSTLPYTSV